MTHHSVPFPPNELRRFLEEKTALYNRPEFIKDDPISIPHRFSMLQDIEISGFFAATFAWGIRKTIINKCSELMALMDNAPYDFIMQHRPPDLAPLLNFKHRTFNATDLFYFIEFFRDFYSRNQSLETAFARHLGPNDMTLEKGLIGFHQDFFSLPDSPVRTQKHIATPARNSSCKRLNMYLRWMVRRDNFEVDFGLWRKLKPSQLLIPEDVHVGRVARQLGLLNRSQTDWQATLELTAALRKLDPEDPVKYDFALFGMGAMEKLKVKS